MKKKTEKEKKKGLESFVVGTHTVRRPPFRIKVSGHDAPIYIEDFLIYQPISPQLRLAKDVARRHSRGLPMPSTHPTHLQKKKRPSAAMHKPVYQTEQKVHLGPQDGPGAHGPPFLFSEKPHIRKQKKYRNEKPKPGPPADAGLFRHAQHTPHGAF